MSIRSAALGLAAGLSLLLAASTAPALTLADLVAGATIQSTSGDFSFSNFTARAVGKGMKKNLKRYRVEATEDGIVIAGKKNRRRFGGLALSYDVAGAAISGVSVGLETNRGGRARAEKKVDKNGTLLAQVSVANGRRGGFKTDEASFALESSVHVEEWLGLRKGIRRFQLSNGFDGVPTGGTVPEPATAMLLATGLGGLAFLGRRRR